VIWKSGWIAALGAALTLSLAAAPAAAKGSLLMVGSSGSQVAALQHALDGAGYLSGSPDGHFGPETEQAVIAYQKVHGLRRSGAVSTGEYEAILHTARPAPPLRGLTRYVYVDLARQVLFEVHDGVVTNTLPISSGGGYTYLSEYGTAEVAKTPTGRFSIHTKTVGWHHSYLGWMYYPSYFDGGYAIHGDTYVPPFPVSHGCIRIPMWDAVPFFNRNPVGTPFFVEP
jgi:peptidoglycan hydrolase-like protein with peptidoglycan-binding domain